MFKTYLRFSNKEKKYKNILLIFFLLFIGYGWYKNGLSYFFLNKMTFLDSLNPLKFVVASILLSIIIESIKKRKLAITKDEILLGSILGLITPVQFPFWIYIILTSLLIICSKFFLKKENQVLSILIFKGVMILITLLMNIPILNKVEENVPYFYGIIDMIFGRNIGAFGTTNIFLTILFYLGLSTDYYYKKEIPVFIISTFFLIFLIDYCVFSPHLTLSYGINSSLIFASVIFAPAFYISPVEKKQAFLYGICIGTTSYLLLRFLKITEGIYLSILLNVFIFKAMEYILYAKKV